MIPVLQCGTKIVINSSNDAYIIHMHIHTHGHNAVSLLKIVPQTHTRTERKEILMCATDIISRERKYSTVGILFFSLTFSVRTMYSFYNQKK